jgi:UDPglucose 6-dehydrogenase
MSLEDYRVIANLPIEPDLEIYIETGDRPLVQVIGLGTVGKAQANVLKKLGCDVFGYDPLLRKAPAKYITFSAADPFSDCDITFICTLEDQVENAVRQLKKCGYKGLIVIKSSVVPKTTKTLMTKYDLHICHNPEFIRERTASQDAANPDRIVIGQCCNKHGQLLQTLYKPLNSRIITVDPTTSETAKLIANSYLALMISFWNQTHQLAKRLDISTIDLAEIITADRRISRHGTKWFGKSFDGKCLPKDLAHLIETYIAEGIEPTLLQATQQINDDCGEPT